MGRTEDVIWLHWDKVSEIKVDCRYCKRSQQQKHATKCKKHTSICLKAPPHVRQQFRDEIHNKHINSVALAKAKKQNDKRNTELSSSQSSIQTEKDISNQGVALEDAECPESSAESSSSNAPLVRNLLINKITKSKHKELELLFAKAMISGNVAYNWTSNYYLKQFFEMLKSGFHPPTRRELTGSILRKLETECESAIDEEIKVQNHLTIVPDGWQNIRGSSIINIMLVNPRCSIFHKSIETGSASQTGLFLEQEIAQVINEVESKHGEKIVAVMSDAGANYQLARTLISNSFPNILSVSCAAHMVNLLAGDLTKLPTFSAFLKKSKEIVKDIRGSKAKTGYYNEEFQKYILEEASKGNTVKKISLGIFSVTRWYGIRDMLYKIQRAKPVLLRLSINDQVDLDAGVRRTLKDDRFWKKLESVFSIYHGLAKSIGVLEKNTACLSDVPEEFGKLAEFFEPDGLKSDVVRESINRSEMTKAQNIFKNRSSSEKITTFHLIANFLDPRYRGKRFENNEEKIQSVLAGIEKYAFDIGAAVNQDQREELGEQLSAFRRREGLFGSTLMSNRTPHIFWENLSQFPSTNMLAKIGSKILSIPASSASVERSFSIQGHLHSKSRNRLTDPHIHKLMRIKWALFKEAQCNQKTRDLMSSSSNNSQMPADNSYDRDHIEDPEGAYDGNLQLGDVPEDEEEEEAANIDELIEVDECYTEAELLELVGLA